MAANAAFLALRERLDARHRDAAAASFVTSEDVVVSTGIAELDRALAGGFTRGTIATIEGAPSSGRSAIAARLLAQATVRGLGAIIQYEDCERAETFHSPALAAAGVRLDRLLVVPVRDPVGAARAADIIVRSGAFPVVAIPTLGGVRGISAATWTRLASLTHRANAVLVATGTEASEELRYFASLRVACAIERVRWNGPSGPFGELAGFDIRVEVRKHKRAAPGKTALVRCGPYESRPAFHDLREHALAVEAPSVRRGLRAVG
jgi:hypothetical protein